MASRKDPYKSAVGRSKANQPIIGMVERYTSSYLGRCRGCQQCSSKSFGLNDADLTFVDTLGRCAEHSALARGKKYTGADSEHKEKGRT